MASPDAYAKLPDLRSIRVIKLRSATSLDDDICFDLITVSLDESPPPSYEALSYTWGGQPLDQVVYADGREFLVTENAKDAMKKLRPYKSGKFLYIWIDAICINQQDIDEKSSQVQMMVEVYVKARRVNIWLGDGNDSSVFILKWLRWTGSVILPFLFVWQRLLVACIWTTTPRRRWFLGLLLRHSSSIIFMLLFIALVPILPIRNRPILQDFKRKLQAGMDDMASREYWERSWTIQEASVNFSCYIFCGPSPPLPLASFIFGHMALGLFYYIYHLEYIILPYRLHLPTYGFYIGEDPIDEQVLESLCLTKVTLDVDKIFALKAMFPRALSTLLVDYSRPARDVYIDAARLMLEATQSVKFLRHACHGSRMDGFPTWVPAWNAGSYIPTKISKFVPAMVSQHPIVSQDSDKHILKLKALRVDTATASISKLFQILHPLSVPWSRSMALDAAEETCDVFKNWVEASLDTNETELKLNQLASLVAGVLDLKADEIRSWFPKIWEEGEYGTGLQSPEARKVSRDFPALMTGRSLFTTEDGRVGMSTLVICEGDEIVMLSGEEFPYLIRKCPSQPGNYTLVCPYWTSGAVNGEAWPSRSGNGLEEDLEYIELV